MVVMNVYAAEPISPVYIGAQGWRPNVIPSCTMYASVRGSTNYSERIFGVLVDNSSTGKSFTVTSSTAGFSSFVNYLKANDSGHVLLEFVSTTDSTVRFSGGVEKSQLPNLQGTEIGSVTISLELFILDTPGQNLAHDGVWTDYDMSSNLLLKPKEPPKGTVISLF
jgi:hypothetical protein